MSNSHDSPEITIDQSLLVEANWLLRQGHRMIAVFIAIKACEVVVARAVRNALAEKNLGHLYGGLREAVGHFDVRHGNPCRLYEALTRHPLQQEASEMGIWSKFLRALDLQDKIVFEGAQIERDDADMVIDVATRFVELVTRANKL
jgi:hypothetical protein